MRRPQGEEGIVDNLAQSNSIRLANFFFNSLLARDLSKSRVLPMSFFSLRGPKIVLQAQDTGSHFALICLPQTPWTVAKV